MVEKLERSTDNLLGFKLSGKLQNADYDYFVPLVDDAVAAHGKVRMLAWFHQFEGWDLAALWDDIKFTANHSSDIDRIAIVGEKVWEEWMAKVCKPFTQAEVRYYDATDLDTAWGWLEETE